MKGGFQKIGVWLLGVFCFSFLVALVLPLAIWIITYIFLGFSDLIKLHVAFLWPIYIVIGVSLWLRYSRDKSSIKDASGILEKIGFFVMSIAVYSVSIAFIFFIIALTLNFILSLFPGEQYDLLNWFYDLSENSRFALIIAIGILAQILFPYDWKKDNQEQ